MLFSPALQRIIKDARGVAAVGYALNCGLYFARDRGRASDRESGDQRYLPGYWL